MRPLLLLAVVMFVVGGSSGCRTCGDRPRLLDRLFHNDKDDCPSRSVRDAASGAKPCNDLASRGGSSDALSAPMVPSGYSQLHTTPVSSSMPLYSAVPFTAYPTAAAPAFSPPARGDELPMPSNGPRIPPTDMPLGPLVPLPPAVPSPSAPSNPGRFTGELRK